MRHDAFYGDTYALYNIETRKLARLTAPLYMLLHLFYTKAMSYKDIKDNLAEKGIFLKWDNVCQIEKEFGFENYLSKVIFRIIRCLKFLRYNQ